AIVPDNCATLPPSLAVGRNCSRQLCDTPAVPGGRIQQSILCPRALLARRSNTLVVAYFILTRALSVLQGFFGEYGIAFISLLRAIPQPGVSQMRASPFFNTRSDIIRAVTNVAIF
ncbi:MAG: hypothetical protein ACI8W7_002218, partial [Gammaproteobacteria bacterium]